MPRFKRMAAGGAGGGAGGGGITLPIGGIPDGPSGSGPATPPATPATPAPASPGDLMSTREGRGTASFNVSDILLNPYKQVGALSQYEHQKQMRQLAYEASGMAESTRKKLVDHFVERGMGITPEVDEAIGRMVNTFVVDWGDENNERAIFGTMDKLLKNGGPGLAQAGMNILSAFYQQAGGNPNFDPTEMLQILNEWNEPGGDPVAKAVRAWSFMNAATTDPDDILGSMGIGKTAGKAQKAEMLKRAFSTLLASMSTRPSKEQLASNEMAQLYNAHKESLFRLTKDWAKNLMGPVGSVLGEWTALAEGYPGSTTQKMLQPGINEIAHVLTGIGTMPAPWMAPMGAMGAPLTPKTDIYPGVIGGTFATDPSVIRLPFENAAALPRAANSKRKFRRMAQSMSEMMSTGISQSQDVNLPSRQYGGYGDMSDEQTAQAMDAQTRQVEVMSRLFGGELQQAFRRINPMLIQQEQLIEAKISQYQLFVKQWDEDIRSGSGLADPQFAEAMKETSKDMMASYDALLSVYAQMLELLEKDYEFWAANAGRSSDKAMLDAIAIRQLKTKMEAHRMERDRWWARIADVFKMRAQLIQVTSVAPLQAAVEALTTAYGGDFGASAALGAAHLQVADQLGRAEKELEQMGDLSAAKRGHLRRQRLEADTAAVKSIMGGPAETGAGPAATSPAVQGI